jgi:hypothetical protein
MHEQTSDRRHVSRFSPIAGVMALAAALVIGMIVPVTVAAQVLLNGNFENNPQPGFPIVTAPAFIDPGSNTWKVTAGTVNVGTTPAGTTCPGPPATSHCIDLNGDSPGRIEQVIKGTAPGQRCSVTFFMSRHVQLASGSATLRTFINGAPTSPATFVHSLPGVIATDGRWEQKSFSFIAAGTTTTLAFESAMPGPAGPQIDNVTMGCDGGPIGPNPNPTPTPIVPPDPCCPPWNATALADRMVYQAAGGIADPYTLRFQSSAALNSQLITYIAYLHAVNPAATAISIDFALWDAGTGAVPVPSTVTGSSTETWTTSSGPAPVPSFFSAGAMQPNRWYTIKTRIYLNDGNQFFPDSCANVEISVRIQVQALAANPQGGAVLQIRMANGKIIERAVKR